jgi:hypothetical protein
VVEGSHVSGLHPMKLSFQSVAINEVCSPTGVGFYEVNDVLYGELQEGGGNVECPVVQGLVVVGWVSLGYELGYGEWGGGNLLLDVWLGVAVCLLPWHIVQP